MSHREYYLTPEQWEGISVYEARFDLVALCKEKIVIDCENAFVVEVLMGSGLPDRLLLLTGESAKIARCRFTIENPKYFDISICLYDPNTKSYILDIDGEQIVISRRWGEPGYAKNQYDFSGVGRVVWPSSALDQLIIASDELLKIEFDDADIQKK